MQIHQLPEQQAVSDSDMFAVDTGQTTRRTPFSALKTVISTFSHQLTNLASTTATSDSDVLPIDDGNGAKKITYGNLKNKITQEASPAFASEDAASPTAWADVAVLASGEVLTSVYNKISAMFKNIRFLYGKIGSTNISGSGQSTITGAIGNTSISDISDGTITGAINSLNTEKIQEVLAVETSTLLTTTATLPAYTERRWSQLGGTAITPDIPSGYTFVGNVNILVSGPSGVMAYFRGSGQQASQSVDLYIYNASNNAYTAGLGLEVRLYSLCVKN